MSEIKWIKLSTNMFDDEKIKLIRTMPEGDSIALVWIQILCLAGKINDGGWVYMGQNLAYSDEMLATILGHPLNTMRVALSTLEQFGMLDITADGKIDVINWEKHQSTDKMARIASQTRDRQQRHYYRTKLREMGVNVDEAGFTSDTKELKSMYESMVDEPNVRITLPNETEVRSKKEEVRSKKEEVNKDSQQSQKRYADDSQYMKAAVYLFEKIKERLPNKKEPDFQKWADEVRKTVELDGVPIERYKQVLDWSQNDDFWQANILSTAKLRKQFDTIYLQMQRDNKQNPQKNNFQNTRNSQEDAEITPEMMKAYEELKQNERA